MALAWSSCGLSAETFYFFENDSDVRIASIVFADLPVTNDTSKLLSFTLTNEGDEVFGIGTSDFSEVFTDTNFSNLVVDENGLLRAQFGLAFSGFFNQGQLNISTPAFDSGSLSNLAFGVNSLGEAIISAGDGQQQIETRGRITLVPEASSVLILWIFTYTVSFLRIAR